MTDGKTNGILTGMNAAIDAAGRLVIPKRIRDQLGIRPNMRLDILVRGDVVELRPVTRAVRLERRGELLVAVPIDEGPILDQSLVDETLDDVRTQTSDPS